jgi:hypothetical protein
MKQTDRASEPPSCLQPPVFMIGRDSSGHWVVQEPGGTRGGLFVNCGEALKFVKNENSAVRPHAVVWVGGILELNASFASAVRSDQQPADNTFSFRQRRVD